MAHPFLPILIILLFGVGFAGLLLGLSAIIGPRKDSDSKLSVYECGLQPIGTARERMDIKFSLVAMLFLLFDIEAVFLYPWAILYREFISSGLGLFMFIEMAIFIVILTIGLVYIWRKGALEWR